VAAKKTLSGSIDSNQNGPVWLDRVLGCLSPPFTFRNGGSAVTDGAKCRPDAAAKSHDDAAAGRTQKRG
jgi:hypothetical protein